MGFYSGPIYRSGRFQQREQLGAGAGVGPEYAPGQELQDKSYGCPVLLWVSRIASS